MLQQNSDGATVISLLLRNADLYVPEHLGIRDLLIVAGKIAAVGTPHELKQQYAGSRLLWYTPQSDEAEMLLKEEGVDAEYRIDCYHIALDSSEQATALLKKYDAVKDYEFIKGNMDDVFLAVTGKRLGD